MNRRQFVRRMTVFTLGAGAGMRPSRARAAEAIRIGHLVDGTGPMAIMGTWLDRTARAAVDRVNRAGGIAGRKVELIEEDTESKPPTGLRKLNKLILDDKVDFLMGSHLSGVGLGALPVVQRSKVPYFPHGGVAEITADKGNRWGFRITPTVWQEAIIATKWALENVGKRAVIMAADFAWGQDHAKAWSALFEKGGGKVLETIMVPIRTDNLIPYLTRVEAAKPEVFFFALFGPMNLMFSRQVTEMGLTRKLPMVGNYDGYEGVDVTAFEGIHFLTLLPRQLSEVPERLRPFEQTLRTAIGLSADGRDAAGRFGATAHNWISWETVNLIKLGVERSGWRGKSDHPKFIEALEGIEIRGSEDFPQGDKLIRAQDHQALVPMYLERVQNGKLKRAMTFAAKDSWFEPPVDYRKEKLA